MLSLTGKRRLADVLVATMQAAGVPDFGRSSAKGFALEMAAAFYAVAPEDWRVAAQIIESMSEDDAMDAGFRAAYTTQEGRR